MYGLSYGGHPPEAPKRRACPQALSTSNREEREGDGECEGRSRCLRCVEVGSRGLAGDVRGAGTSLCRGGTARAIILHAPP